MIKNPFEVILVNYLFDNSQYAPPFSLAEGDDPSVSILNFIDIE